MVRVLHLRSEPSDEQSRRLSELLAREAPPDIAIERRTIGRGGSYRSLLDATLRLRRELRRFDVLHVWDALGLSTARWLNAPRVVANLTTLANHRPWSSPAGAHWVCSTPYQHALIRDHLRGQARCSLIEPGVTAAEASGSARGTLRAQLGLAEDDRVLLAPGESTREAGHAHAVWVTSMLHIIDPRYKLLIAGTGPYAPAARKMAEALNRPELLRVATDGGVNGSLLPAADAALFTPTGEPPMLPVIDCMAAGLPIVTTDHPALRGFFTDGKGLLLAEWKKAPAIARRVLELFERHGLIESMAAQARAVAAGRFGARELVERYLRVYQELAGQVHGAASPRYGLAVLA